MGFFDSVKEQADKAVEGAKGLADKAGAKVKDVKASRKAGDLLDDLGRFSYADKTGRPIAGSGPEIERIVAELKALEEAGATILPDQTAGDVGPVDLREAAAAKAAADGAGAAETLPGS